VLEHLPDKIFAMNELWRILRPGGIVEIFVPTTEGSGAFQDPTHVSFWNRRSFLYYEAGNSYRDRFAERYGIRAKFRVLAEQTESTIDGPRLRIVLRAVKPGEPTLSQTNIRFVGALRVKNEARHIFEVLTSILPLCECVFVFDDHSTDETGAICRSFGGRVTVFASPFVGLDEARDKNYLLQKIIEVNPEWVLWVDGDEVLERSGPDALLQAADLGQGVASYSVRIAYLWDHPQQVRVDGLFGRFARPSFFRVQGQTVERLRFLATGAGANFHCGNVPSGLVGETRASHVRLKHYGYMLAEERVAKYEWYNKHDPGNTVEDNYRHILGLPGARLAPGPANFARWQE
jgi:hypothetical protein